MNLLDTPIAIHTGDIPLPVDSVRGELEYRMSPCLQWANPVIQIFLHLLRLSRSSGSTGSGKSTLVKLLLRLYSSGTIILDGIDLRG